MKRYHATVRIDVEAESVESRDDVLDRLCDRINKAIGNESAQLGAKFSEQAAKALERLGLANAEFQNRNPEQQFIAVAEAVSGLTTQNERVLAVTELFGKSGANLLPVLQKPPTVYYDDVGLGAVRGAKVTRVRPARSGKKR